jgi:hypothetical protein
MERSVPEPDLFSKSCGFNNRMIHSYKKLIIIEMIILEIG